MNRSNMKNLKYLVILLLFMICISCERQPNSPVELQFEKMEIHYTKSGGWIQTVYLDILGNGIGYIHYPPQSSLADSTFWLTNGEKERLATLFSSFSDYNSHYEPDEFFTDQNYHSIIFIYNQKPDTVSVYDLGHAQLPLSLQLLINNLENLAHQHLR